MTAKVQDALTQHILQVVGPMAAEIDRLNSELDNVKATGGGAPTTIEVSLLDTSKTKTVESAHFNLEKAVKILAAIPAKDRNLYVWGEDPGAGKSFLATQIADALDLTFTTTGWVNLSYEFFGFRDGNGQTVRPQFREAWEHGGVVCIDEGDRFDPAILLTLNEALSSGVCAFPDGPVKRHDDCIVIITGNTAMNGADSNFVTAVKHDASAKSRLVFLHTPADEKWERKTFAQNPDWTKRVQRLRKVAKAENLSNVFCATPRDMIRGACMLDAGFTQKEVEDMLILCGAPVDSVNRLYAKAGAPADSNVVVIGD